MSPHASGESGFAVWLGAERKSTTRNAQRANAYVMLLRRRRPWQQLCTLRLIYFVVAAKYARRPLDYHTPAFGNAMVVGLEQHVIVDRSAHQFGALGGAEQQRPVLDDEVDREDVRPAIDAGDEPPQRDARQKIPAFRLRQDGDRLDSSYMAATLATVVARRYGQKSHKLSTNGHAPISSARSVGSVHGAADHDRDSRVVQQVESYGTQHGVGQKPAAPAADDEELRVLCET